MKTFLFISTLILTTIVGCQSKEKSNEKELMTPEVALADAQELDKVFLLEDFSLFEEKREKYLAAHPNSIYAQFVHLLTSKLMLKKNMLPEAMALNLEVQNKTFISNKEIYYQALFDSADIFEAQEQFEKSLGALIETEKNKSLLPARKRLFELPLKLSVAYARLGLNELTIKYLKETQGGLNEYLRVEPLDNIGQAKLYLEIGGGLTQWQSNDFELELRKFLLTYRFLVYSMNRNESGFSDKAQKKLMSQIQWIWNLSQAQKNAADFDKVEEEKNRFLKMTEVSKLLNSIKMLEPLENQKRSLLQNEFFNYVEQVQNIVLEKIFAQYRYTPPTQESFRHQIFRENLTIDNLDNQFK